MAEERQNWRVPRGWPSAVSPPGTQEWEASATAWLRDLLPECRHHPEVQQHPVVLAFIARHVLAGAVDGARQGYRTIRRELGSLVPSAVIAAALGDLRNEGQRLSAALRAVELVEHALRGK